MTSAESIRLNNLMGSSAVLREVVIALISVHPDRAALLSRALATTQQWQDLALASPQPDAVLAGMAEEQRRLQKLLDSW
jgi:acyl carrier protein phosphodiesterase